MDQRDSGLNLDHVREVFDASKDFTIGIEEEFALVDPETLDLVPAFEELSAAAATDASLSASVAGELISSEIEIRSGRGETFEDAVAKQLNHRRGLFDLAERRGLLLGATGTHPWADYRDQSIIDTPHYQRLQEELQWVARRNNTWSLHVHVGIRGADRAIAVCDHLREVLPLMLAVSANSPFLEARDSGLDSVRTQIFSRMFPRCGIPDSFGDWAGYSDFVGTLATLGAIVESTQLWWSVRPHHAFGTVEVRICDAQSDGRRSTEMAGLISAIVAQIAIDLDGYGIGGAPFGPTAGAPLRDREIEENLWRAIRYGAKGEMFDFRARRTVPVQALLESVWEWTEPARASLGIEAGLPEGSPAEEFRARVQEQGDLASGYRKELEVSQYSYPATGPDCASVPGDGSESSGAR